MLGKLRAHVTFANVVSLMALFVALSGGAYALTIPKNSVGAKQLKKNAVSSIKVKDRSLLSKDFKPGQLPAGRAGPQGAQGAQGQQGAQGAQGQQGAAGSDLTAVCEGGDGGDVMVQAGATCMDRYEASIWTAPTGGTQITGTLPCNANGNDCKGMIYARSVAGVSPRASITYFQAQQALANSGKRLLSNAEWQAAVAGTPDSTACNVGTAVANTGANAGCVSAWGANDMVGNVWEWVADWVPASTACPGWSTSFSDDSMCLSGASTTAAGPGALLRGGSFFIGTSAGPFTVDAVNQPSSSGVDIGFRGAR